MRKAFFILTGLVIVGCTTTPVATIPEPMAAIKPIPEVVIASKKPVFFITMLIQLIRLRNCRNSKG